MTVNISAAFLLGLAVFLMVRYSGLKAWHAIACASFGFFLATSTLAPTINMIFISIFGIIGR